MYNSDNLNIDINSSDSDHMNHYDLLMQASSECICDLDLVTGKLYLSESFKSVFDISPLSADKNLEFYKSLIHPDDVNNVESIFDDAINNTKKINLTIEYKLKNGNGEYSIVQDKFIILRDNLQKAYRVLSVIRDVSSEYFYKKIENAEREIMQLSMLNDISITDIITKYLLKIESIFPSMKASVLRVKNNKIENLSSPSLPSAYIEKLNGLEIGENRGSCGTAAFTNKIVIVEDIQNDVRWAEYKELAATFNLLSCWSQPICNSDNEVIATFANYYHEKKSPNKWESYAIDRSQKLLSLIFSKFEYVERLQSSNTKFKYVNQLTNDAIYEWNILEGTNIWGEGMSKIYGYDFKSDVKYPASQWKDLIHPNDYNRVHQKIDEFILDPNNLYWEVEYKMLKADQTCAHVKEIGHVIRNEQGKATKIYGLIRDITKDVMSGIVQQLKNEISFIFNERELLNGAIDKLLTLVLSYSNFETAEIWLKSKDKKYINLISTKAKSNTINKYFEQTREIKTFEYNKGILGKILGNNSSLVLNDLANTPYFLRKEMASKHGLIAAVGMPLNYSLNSIGVLLFFNSTKINETDYTLEILYKLKDFIGAEIIRKQQEEELFLLFESSPDILVIVSPNGYFTRVNHALCELLGYTDREIKSTPFINFIHPDDLKNTQNMYKELSASGEKNQNDFINRYRTKDGKYKWISWNTSEVFGEDGSAFAYGRDITNVVELEQLLNTATSLSKVGGWELDLSVKNNGYIYWSKVTKDIFGVDSTYTPTLAESYKFFTKESKIKLKNALKGLVQNVVEFDIELQCITKNNIEKWIRAIGKSEFLDGKCVKIYGSYQDIDKQKINELKLIESEKIYSDIFHFSPVPKWIIDLNNLKFFDVNLSALQMYGYNYKEFMSLNVGEIRPIEEREKMFEIIKNHHNKEDAENFGILNHIKKNGDRIKVDIRCKGILYNNKEAIIVSGIDVTERLSHLEKLELQNNKLKQVAWLQSHVVRAPLARLMGLIDLILDPVTSESDRIKSIEFFKKSANELDDIIKDIVIKSQEFKD